MKTRSSISRRRFLRRSGGALGAALAFPTFIPASALGRNGAMPPSERITMGFIGIGHQGGGHLLGGGWTYVAGGYAGRKDTQVVAVCDVRKERRDEATQKVNAHYQDVYGDQAPKCQAYNDFRDVLARPDIDAVLIATPAHWHATMAAMAAEAGKDIYCEKPSACTIDEAKAMRTAVQRYGRVYQAGTQQRSEYGGKFRMACEFVRSGRIGKLREIYGYRDGGGIFWPKRFTGKGQPIPAGFDWDLYLGPAPMIPFDGKVGPHRFDIGEMNWGQHHYDIIQWAADADDSGPVELFMEQDRSCYKYGNGVVVYGRPYPGEPVGSDGGACFIGTEGRIAVDRDSLVSDPPDLVREPLHPKEVHLYHANSHSGNFVECVRTRQRTICPVEVAARSASAVLLGGVVKQLNRPLKWDPVAEHFVGDDEANRLCSIAKRPPWNI